MTSQIHDLDRKGRCNTCKVIYEWTGLPLARDAICFTCKSDLGRAFRHSKERRVFATPGTRGKRTRLELRKVSA